MTSPDFFPNDNRISSKKTSRVPSPLCAVRGFLLSPAFMLIPTIVACVFSLLGEEYTMIGLIVNAQIFAFALFFCDDFAAAMMPFLAVMCQGSTLFNNWTIIVPHIIPWGIAPALSLVFHLIVYRKPLRNGISLYGLFATAAALILGGLGAGNKLSPLENAEGLFYYFALSFGMILFYFLFAANYKRPKDYDVYDHFLWQLFFSGILCSLILLRTILNFGEGPLDFIEFRNVTAFRNSLANIMIMGLPAPFYFAGKKGLPLVGRLFAFGIGLLVYLSLCLTTSRTAILFGSLLLLLCLIYYFRHGVGRLAKWLNLAMLLAATSAFWLICPRLFEIFNLQDISAFLKGFPDTLFEFGKYEARVKLFFRACRDFAAHPIFGVGLLSQNNTDVYPTLMGCICWYHMYFPQIFGSMGLVGAAAYTVHLGLRARLLFFCPDFRSRAISLTALSLFLYSLTDPGEFMPIPFGMMATLAFVLLERHMETHPDRQLSLPNAKKIKKTQKTIDKTKKI